MGAEAYTWITKYRKNLAEALENARRETFASGKFLGAEDNPETIEDAMEFDPAGGTGSLLEIMDTGEKPELLRACRLPKEKLLEFFGTLRPSFDEIVRCMPFWESFDRGEARAIVLYENDRPAKICFAGWTLDNPAAGSGSFEDVKSDGIRKLKSKKRNPLPPPPPPLPSPEERSADLKLIQELMECFMQNVTLRNMKAFALYSTRIDEILLKYENAMDMEFYRELITIQSKLAAIQVGRRKEKP